MELDFIRKMNNCKNTVSYLAIVIMSFMFYNANSQVLLTHDFEDGTLGPFEVNKANQTSRVYVKDGALETHWDQSKYDGTNSGRKAQFRPIGWDPNNWQDGFYFQKELWMGFKLKVHEDYMKDNIQADACFMQIWGNQGSNLGNHYAMLKFEGRNGGELTWYNRWCCGSANNNQFLVYSGFPREEFVEVIIHVNLASYAGAVKIWVNGELKLSTSGQRMGWGEMDATGMINETYSTLSMGQYNYRENAGAGPSYDNPNQYYSGHLENETRTVTYDDVTLYTGANGYDIVNSNFNSLSKEEVNLERSISLYPNPVISYFSISNSIGATIEIFDMLGRSMGKSEIKSKNQSVYIGHFNKGMYVVKIINRGNVYSKTIIKN